MAATAGALALVTVNPGRTASGAGDEQPDRLERRPAASRSREGARAGSAAPSRDRWLVSGGAGSPGTGYSCSPETRSAMRVVTRAVRFAASPEQVADDRRALDDLLEVVEDQQDPLLADATRRAHRPPGGSGCRAPAVDAMVGATSAGSRTGSRATNQTPSGNRPRRSPPPAATAASCPCRPGPVRVSRRVLAAGPAASASSSSRPTNVVSWVGRLFGRASSERSGGNSDRRPSTTSWQIRSGRRSLSRCSPRSRRRDAGRAARRDESPGRVRAGSGRRGRRRRCAPPG